MRRVIFFCTAVFFILYSFNVYAKILNGKILVVNKDHNFVIINLGKDNGVKKGMVFLVYREKKLIGKVETEEVFKEMSSCNILPWMSGKELKRNDGILKP